MNDTRLVDLSMTEMLTVSGGEDLEGPKLTCYLLGAGFAVGIVAGGLAGWVGAALAANEAHNQGCLNW